jgi:hypothetical protein
MPGRLARIDFFAGPFLAIGVVVVVTLVTLPYAGTFFAAALAGGAIVAGAMLWWHLRRHP